MTDLSQKIDEPAPSETAPPEDDFVDVGLALKEKREELSYTIEHVAEITRITLTNLRAIETGEMEMLPGLVFVRGFVRNYASLLGLSADWMIVVLNRVYGQSIADNAAAESDSKKARFDNTQVGIALGVVLVVILMVLVFGRSGNTMDQNQEVIQAVATGVQPKNAGAKAQAELLQTVISPLNLVLMGKLNQWVSVAVDDQAPKQLFVETGKKYEFPGQEAFQLVMTTGASASIYLNGEEIEVPIETQNQLYTSKLNKFSLVRQNN